MVVGGCRPYGLLQNDNTKIRNVMAGAFRISVKVVAEIQTFYNDSHVECVSEGRDRCPELRSPS